MPNPFPLLLSLFLPTPFSRVVIALCSVVLASCANVPSIPGPPMPEPKPTPPTVVVPPKPPIIGLALGGGAARGFAHIGVIQVLEESGIRPDLVVGTSAGSVVAALYASGKSGRALQLVAESMDEAAFSDWRLPFSTSGLLRGEALARFIRTQVGSQQIQDLALPLGVVATDLHSGQGVLFRRGDTATAVRASSAVPAVFQPVAIAGRDYVDGGLVAPVPVHYARQMGAQVVIAVDISNPPESNAAKDTLQVLMQTFTIMGKSISSFELRDADVVVKPAIGGMSSANFASRAQAIAAGRQAMQPHVAALRQAIQAKTK